MGGPDASINQSAVSVLGANLRPGVGRDRKWERKRHPMNGIAHMRWRASGGARAAPLQMIH